MKTKMKKIINKKTMKSKEKKTVKKSAKTKVKENIISKEMTFAELLNKYSQSANILFESGLHCIGCGGAMYETIEQGCMMHGFTKKQIDDLIKKLNKKK
jgi:hybrid cluster-associated redox disulfide protein